MKAKIAVIVIVILVIAAAAAYLVLQKKPHTGSQQNQTEDLKSLTDNLDIKTFYVSGTVTAIAADRISFDADILVGGKSQIRHYTAIVDKGTKIITKRDGSVVTYGGVGSLKAGQILNFSTTTYPYDQQEIHPTEIAVVK